MAERPSPPPLPEFDITTIPSHGYVEVPAPVIAAGKLRIKQIMPGEWRFVSNGSVLVDKDSSRLSIDVDDTVPEDPTSLKQLESRPAVMRVLKGMGTQALSGFVIDYRRVRSHLTEDRGLSEGVGSTEFMEKQSLYGAELPLGVLFSYYDSLHYIGHGEAVEETRYLAGQVDAFVAAFDAPVPQPRRAMT